MMEILLLSHPGRLRFGPGSHFASSVSSWANFGLSGDGDGKAADTSMKCFDVLKMYNPFGALAKAYRNYIATISQFKYLYLVSARLKDQEFE